MKHLFVFIFMLLSFGAFSQTVTNTVTLDGSGSSDADGSIVKYAWSQTGGPVTTTITNADQTKATVTYNTPGVYTYNLAVTDNDGATATASTQVTVLAANAPPKAVITVTQITIKLPAAK